MSTYGQTRLDRVGKSIQVTADGAPKAKAGGITTAWSLIAAFAADFTVRPTGETNPAGSGFYEQNPSDDFVYAGEKYLRYGSIMCRIVGGTADGLFAPFGTDLTTPGGALSTAKGDVYVLNESVHENEPGSDHGGAAIDGGRIFAKRLLVIGLNPAAAAEVTALHGATVTAMPRATFEAALPNFTYVAE